MKFAQNPTPQQMPYQLQKILAVVSIIGAFNIFSQGSVSAVSFNFTQAGWSQSGIVTGSFEGEDLNGDGFISETEVTNFSLAWSGNGEVPTFNFADVDTWQFSTSQEELISGFTSQATSFWSYDGIIGSVGIGGFAGIISDTTPQAPVFTSVNTQSVPEPSLIGTSLVALFAIPLRKKFLVNKQI